MRRPRSPRLLLHPLAIVVIHAAVLRRIAADPPAARDAGEPAGPTETREVSPRLFRRYLAQDHDAERAGDRQQVAARHGLGNVAGEFAAGTVVGEESASSGSSMASSIGRVALVVNVHIRLHRERQFA